MRKSLGFVATMTVAATLAATVSARAADLTDKMAPYSYLLGAPWNCVTNVPAMMGQPAHTDQGTATFEVAPGNTVHNHAATPTYSGDFYIGYSDRVGSYWQVDADNLGAHAFLTSTDGKSYTGTSSMGPLSMQDEVTYTKIADNKVNVREVLTGAAPSVTIDSACTR
jgi:hypothetical protein